MVMTIAGLTLRTSEPVWISGQRGLLILSA